MSNFNQKLERTFQTVSVLIILCFINQGKETTADALQILPKQGKFTKTRILLLQWLKF